LPVACCLLPVACCLLPVAFRQFSFAELQVPEFCPEKKGKPVCVGCVVAHRWFILAECCRVWQEALTRQG